MNDLRKNEPSRMSLSSNTSTTPPLIRPVKQWFTPMVAAIVLLALSVLAGTAQAASTSFSVTGTAQNTLYGYTNGQSYTFNWIVNSGFTNNGSSYFASGVDLENYWADENTNQAPVITAVSGDGLTGTYVRPTVGWDDPYSAIDVWFHYGVTNLTLSVANDAYQSIGLQANGTDIRWIEASDLYIGDIWSFPGSYTDPNVYFAAFTGTYTPTAGDIMLIPVSGDVLHFTPTSLTISTIPEPSTALLTALGLAVLVIRRRRHSQA
jgi:hypothetical protein